MFQFQYFFQITKLGSDIADMMIEHLNTLEEKQFMFSW